MTENKWRHYFDAIMNCKKNYRLRSYASYYHNLVQAIEYKDHKVTITIFDVSTCHQVKVCKIIFQYKNAVDEIILNDFIHNKDGNISYTFKPYESIVNNQEVLNHINPRLMEFIQHVIKLSMEAN